MDTNSEVAEDEDTKYRKRNEIHRFLHSDHGIRGKEMSLARKSRIPYPVRQ